MQLYFRNQFAARNVKYWTSPVPLRTPTLPIAVTCFSRPCVMPCHATQIMPCTLKLDPSILFVTACSIAMVQAAAQHAAPCHCNGSS